MSNIKDKSNDDIKSNITQLLNSFNHFNSLMENTIWIKTAQVEEIKTLFKLGNFIERSARHLSSQNALEEFLNIYKIQHGNKEFCDQHYICACDELLKVFFTHENVPELTLDIVIRIYTSVYPKDRLHHVLYDLMLTSNNLEALSDFINALPKERSREFEYYLSLSGWNHLKNTKNVSYFYNIREQLSLFNLENNLGSLLGVLSLSVADKEQPVQNDILEIILEKMLERNILSNSFWYALFHKMELDLLCKVCKNFDKFCSSLFSFIIYLGSMMDKDGNIWKSDPSKSVCPDISFYDLLIIIKKIHKFNSKFVLNELEEAKSDTGSEIWDEIKHELSLICEEKLHM